MKKLTVLISFVFAFLLINQPNVYAEHGWLSEKDGEWKAKWEEKRKEMHKQLGLSEEQEKQLEEHRNKFRAGSEGMREQIKVKREEIRTELQKSDFDVNKVKQSHEELKALRNKKDDARLDGILEIRKVLTDEQFKKFMELKDDFKGRGKHGESQEGEKE